MRPSQLLIAARALIADPRDWCQGKIDHLLVPRWACWIPDCLRPFGHMQRCSLGALIALGDDDLRYRDAVPFLNQAAELLGYRPHNGNCMAYVCFNDSRTHADVMRMWDRAIELAEAAEMYAELGEAPAEEVTHA